MRALVIFALKHFLFWLLYFAFTRLLFLIYNFKKLANEDFSEVLQSFWYAVPLDISAASYLLGLSLIFSVLYFIFSKKIWLKINRIWVFFLLTIISILCASELLLYDEWGAKIHYKIFNHLQHPAEVFKTATPYHYLIFGAGLLIYLYPSFTFYNRFFHQYFSVPLLKIFLKLRSGILFFLVAGFGIVLGIRGGFREIPINQSVVYYTKNNLLNAATINTPWNLVYSVVENRKSLYKNPFVFYDLKEAYDRARKLFEVEKDTTYKILTTEKPNIVIFMLEGWSIDLMKSYNSDIDVTPNFDSLSNEGLLFTNIYTSGWTSDFGMGAILSAYPALSIACIVAQESKFSRVNCINKVLKPSGYQSSYFFGGELNYGNIKSYLAYQGFDKLVEQKDFPSEFPSGRLGIHDEYVFPFQLKQMEKEKEPFLSAIFNVSSHSPYDMPVDSIITYSDKENMYINSVHYADHCIGEYFKQARKQKWFDNTLFVLIADHSHNTHINSEYTSSAHSTIPFLLYGNVIKPEFHGKRIDKLGSQTDFLATLLSQLNLKNTDFRWSKNLLNPYVKEFAHFTHPAGFGWVTPSGNYSYHYQINSFLEENFSDSSVKDSIIKDGKCYMQSVFQEFSDF